MFDAKEQFKVSQKACDEMNGMLTLHEVGMLGHDQVVVFGQQIIQKFGPIDEATGERFRKVLQKNV